MSKNVLDQLVETLVEAGIQRIYAVTGACSSHQWFVRCTSFIGFCIGYCFDHSHQRIWYRLFSGNKYHQAF